MPFIQFKILRKQSSRAWERLWMRAVKAPKEFWVIGALCLLVLVLVGLHTVFSKKTAILRVRVQHSFRTAQIMVQVDDETAYSGKLTGTMHRKFGLLPEGISGSWSQGIPVTAGRHRVSVRVVGDDGSDHVDNTAATFPKGGERELDVVARHADLSANWSGGGNAVSAGPATLAESQPSFFSRYASGFLLTIAGSIVSALSGYAIREIPARLRAKNPRSASRSAAAGR
jgi:hypothetical protein